MSEIARSQELKDLRDFSMRKKTPYYRRNRQRHEDIENTAWVPDYYEYMATFGRPSIKLTAVAFPACQSGITDANVSRFDSIYQMTQTASRASNEWLMSQLERMKNFRDINGHERLERLEEELRLQVKKMGFDPNYQLSAFSAMLGEEKSREYRVLKEQHPGTSVYTNEIWVTVLENELSVRSRYAVFSGNKKITEWMFYEDAFIMFLYLQNIEFIETSGDDTRLFRVRSKEEANKALGYGIIVPTDDYKNIVNSSDQVIEKSLEGYDGFVEEKLKGTFDRIKQLHYTFEATSWKYGNIDLKEIIGYNVVKTVDLSETGETAVIIIPVSEYKENYRYDNAIDYYEVFADTVMRGDKDPLKTVLKKLDTGIFPFNNFYTNKNDPERQSLDGKILNELKDYDQIVSINDKQGLDLLNETAIKLGFKDYDDYKENIVPKVPAHVVALAEYLDVFKDKKTALTLEPMFATWWD